MPILPHLPRMTTFSTVNIKRSTTGKSSTPN